MDDGSFSMARVLGRNSNSPKELVPIVGSWWKGKKILCLCDNMAVVYAINKGSARDPKLMKLLRVLAFLCAVHSIDL